MRIAIKTLVSWPGLVVACILALGLALRLGGIGYGLPYTYAPDEPTYLTIVLKMLRTGDLNPHWWYYPSLMFYIQAIAFLLYFLVGRVTGVFTTPADIPLPRVITMGVGHLAMPSEFLLARGVTTVFSAAGILLVYMIGRRLHVNKWVGVVAALLFAVSPTIMDSSRWIGPDILALFFALVSFYFTLGIAKKPRLRNYVLAGVTAGLATSAKYNAALILAPLVVAHVLRFRRAAWRHPEILAAATGAGLGFLIGTPFALIDFQGFWEGVRFQAFSYTAEGHAGQEGDALRWYASYLAQSETWVALGAVASAAFAVVSRKPKYLILVSYPLVYLGFISLMLVRNTRTVLQALPFLELLAAIGLVSIAGWLIRTRRLSKPIVVGACSLLVALTVVSPLQGAIAAGVNSANLGDREVARAWIDSQLPAGSRIAQEAYTPYIDPDRYVVQGEYGLIDHSPDWYVQNGYEYLVFSDATYGRYFADTARYGQQAAEYDKLFAVFPEIARFGGIRVYKTGTTVLPTWRVAAEWGVYEPWIELVGYDWQDPALTLYWRILRARREPLAVTARLLNSQGSIVTGSTMPLLGGNSAVQDTEGIVRVPWEVNAPVRARPGAYQMELDIDAGGLGRIPVLGSSRKPVADKQFIGPLRLAPLPPSTAELSHIQPLGARFGSGINLLGYRAEPGKLVLYWQSTSQVVKDYTVFVHLLDAAGDIRAQTDSAPCGGAYPTLLWGVGETIRDEHAFAELLPGEHTLELGMYDYPGLERLPVTDRNGNRLGDHLTIKVTVP